MTDDLAQSAPQGKTIKLRISFTGMECNALRSLFELEELAKSHEDFDEFANGAYTVQSCISAFRDTILALCKGMVDVEAVKDFWFNGVDVEQVPFSSDVIKFEEQDEAA